MSFITYSNTYQPNIKHLKFYKEAIALVQGVKMNPKLDLCDIRIPFDQYESSSYVLGKNVKNKRIDFSSLGSNITTVILKATYDKSNIDTLNNYVNYVLDGDLGSTKLFSTIMILSGTPNRPVPGITLSNPNEKYSVKIEVLAISVDTDITSETPDFDLIIAGLSFNSIRTLTQGESIGVYDNSNNIVQTIQLVSISNTVITGMIVEIDDSSIGTIGLQFNTEYDARQFFSAINWLINDTDTRTLPQPADITAPVITYKNDVAPNTTLSTYTSGFTKQNAITLCINSITDSRDGSISLSELIVDMQQGDVKFNTITVTGTYFLSFKISDIAGNENIKTVQITFV